MSDLAMTMPPRCETAPDATPAGLPATDCPRLCVVGPLPPPSGGMANQCEQLLRLLRQDGASVELVRTNAPYRPGWIGRVPMLRSVFRLLPYLWALWRATAHAQVMHVFANSGWAWHLFAAPALAVARLRGVPVIVNYRGGNADPFLAKAPRRVLGSLRRVPLRVTPSAYLLRVFGKYGLDAEIIPNVIDLSRFEPTALRDFGDAPHLLVSRNLEPIYGIGTAVRAFARVRRRFAGARLTVAGSGPELARLQALVAELGLTSAVRFTGRVDNAEMPGLYAAADCMLNPSTVDNMPISILEAFASARPVVSTDAGGIPDLVADGVSGLLVPVGDSQAMGDAACRVLEDRALAASLVRAGLGQAEQYAWARVRTLWLDAYRRAAAQGIKGVHR
jgi:glycosyltransferase involved in cell wall biosynthesis